MNTSEHLSLHIPEQKNYDVAYGLAFKLAAEKLSNTADIEALCRNSGSLCRMEGRSGKISLKFLNQEYMVTWPEVVVSLPDSAAPIELRDQVLILHYLTQARAAPLSGRLISYQELKEGAVYLPSFIKRAVQPLIDFFGRSPERLLEAAVPLGGQRTAFGDLAVTIPAFSRVPLTLVIWRGDEEFPPNASILFDSTVLDYLSPEDLNVLCQTISWRLVKMLSANSTPA